MLYNTNVKQASFKDTAHMMASNTITSVKQASILLYHIKIYKRLPISTIVIVK